MHNATVMLGDTFSLGLLMSRMAAKLMPQFATGPQKCVVFGPVGEFLCIARLRETHEGARAVRFVSTRVNQSLATTSNPISLHVYPPLNCKPQNALKYRRERKSNKISTYTKPINRVQTETVCGASTAATATPKLEAEAEDADADADADALVAAPVATLGPAFSLSVRVAPRVAVATARDANAENMLLLWGLET